MVESIAQSGPLHREEIAGIWSEFKVTADSALKRVKVNIRKETGTGGEFQSLEVIEINKLANAFFG